jgi:hypothetical protein
MAVKISYLFLSESCQIMGRESCAEIQINVNFWETLLLKIPLETLLRKREDTYRMVADKGGDFIGINETDVFFFSGNEWMSFTDFEKKVLYLYHTRNSAYLSIM